MSTRLHIIKIGGFVIDQPDRLNAWLSSFQKLNESVILVHGGGRAATRLSEKLEIPVQMRDGRRITDAQTIEVVTMVYAGLINKSIVAQLNISGKKAVGLSGVDLNLIPVIKRSPHPIDYGFVGDILKNEFPSDRWEWLVQSGFIPVISPISADDAGVLLNINADTIAHTIATGLSQKYETHLWFAFEKPGVLADSEDDASVIPTIRRKDFDTMKISGSIHGGMIPKLENALNALEQGVKSVHLGTPETIISCISGDEMLHTVILD